MHDRSYSLMFFRLVADKLFMHHPAHALYKMSLRSSSSLYVTNSVLYILCLMAYLSVSSDNNLHSEMEVTSNNLPHLEIVGLMLGLTVDLIVKFFCGSY